MTPKAWPAPRALKPVDADVTIPGSKSLTNRELVLSALASGPSTLSGALRARDTDLMVAALRKLGAEIDMGADNWQVSKIPCVPHSGPVTIDCGLAGTVMRFIPAVASLYERDVRFIADEQANERPVKPLYQALRSMGVDFDYEGEAQYPVTMRGPAKADGPVRLDSSGSSQFLSALLLVAPLLEADADWLEIELTGALPSKPHIEMTIDSLRRRGIRVEWTSDTSLRVKRGDIQPRDVVIEPDLSNAGPFLAAAVVTAGHVRVPYWPLTTTQAGDAWQSILRQMGQEVDIFPLGTQYGTLCVRGHEIKGFEGDMSQVGELVPTLAAVCALASTPSRITNIGHLRGHETDRLAAIATELRKLGVDVDEGEDYLAIDPTNGWREKLQGPVELHSYSDHRMATFAAIIGLVVPEVYVDDIETVSKTMPDFVDRWNKMLNGGANAQA
ncbi:MAG: 3-phosphoshikimate 1-carboxyvinyltransferase [Actinomycetaceae bacterium]|nr:3-phosphoshikimate 1-carboxyvinyltransferase [Actinomycetaceae bacterium]